MEAAITPKTRALILCSPSNPTGSVYSKEELAGLARILAQHERVIVIADEIYEHINYIGKHESIAQFAEIKDRVVIVNGVSKAYAMTGWRIGFNRRIVQNALACKQDVENGKKLSHLQRANYRWMLIQPFMAIDDYSTAALTSKQKEALLDMSNELPMLLNKLELEKQTKEEEDKFTKVLSEYFLKSYLSTSL